MDLAVPDSVGFNKFLISHDYIKVFEQLRIYGGPMNLWVEIPLFEWVLVDPVNLLGVGVSMIEKFVGIANNSEKDSVVGLNLIDRIRLLPAGVK